jgi:hypothetical protein
MVREETSQQEGLAGGGGEQAVLRSVHSTTTEAPDRGSQQSCCLLFHLIESGWLVLGPREDSGEAERPGRTMHGAEVLMHQGTAPRPYHPSILELLTQLSTGDFRETSVRCLGLK